MERNHYENHFKYAGHYLEEGSQWVEKVVASSRSPAKALYADYNALLDVAEAKAISLRNLSTELSRMTALEHYATCELLRRKSMPLEDLFNDEEFLCLANIGAHVPDEGETTCDPKNRSHWVKAHGNILFSLASFDNAGHRSYEVTSGLAQQLLLTELRGLRCDDIRLPYESVYVQIPSSLDFHISGTVSPSIEKNVFEGAYITESSSGGKRFWDVTAVAKSRVQKIGERAFQNYSVMGFLVVLKDGELLDVSIKNMADQQPGITYHGRVDPEGTHTSTGDFFRWLMNLMLYATWPDAEVEHVMANKEARNLWKRIQKLKKGKKKEGLLKKFRNVAPQNRIILGRSIQVNRQEDRSSSSSGIGKPLVVRTRVAGHWRNQPHGPGRTLRRRQWITPFWRGPEDGPLGPSVHRLTMRDSADL